MKKFILVCAAVLGMTLAANEAKAQLKVGFGYSGFLDKTVVDSQKECGDLHGFNIDLGYNFLFSYGETYEINMLTGIIYDYLSTDQDPYSQMLANLTGVEHNEHYLSVPFLFDYRLVLDNIKPFVFAGPMLSFGVGSQTTLRYTYLGANGKLMPANLIFDNYSGKVTVNDGTDAYTGKLLSEAWKAVGGANDRWFDVKFGVGLGIDVMERAELRLGYYFGLIDRDREKFYDKHLVDQFSVTALYSF